MIPSLANPFEEPERPRGARDFDACLSEWRGHLLRHLGSIGTLRWVLRENLSAGHDENDPAVALHYQCFAPALSSADVARVYARERVAGRPVHFALVAALPDALLVSLRREATWARHVDAGDGVTMQIEPSFHSFVEVTDRDTWRRIAVRPVQGGEPRLLESVLSLRRRTHGAEPEPTRH